MYTSIGTALYTLLNDSTFKTDNSIAVVYNYAERELVTYPAITIVALGHDGSFADTSANIRVYSYVIRVLVRAGDESISEATTRTLVDAVINRLESNLTLTGACDYMTPSSASYSWSNDDIPVRYADITVQIRKRYIR